MRADKSAHRTVAAMLLAGCALSASAEGIYSCIDAKGRHLTSDRPIAACLDRPQVELNPSGTVKRTLPPSLTADERAQLEEKARQEKQERARAAEQRRRELALLARYPDQAAHDRERRAALAVADDVTATAMKHTAVLQSERKKIDDQLEFYKSDPSKIPARLKHQLEQNEREMAEQQRFIANQQGEKQRINARFDEELKLLRKLWAAQPPASAASATSAR